MPLRLAGVRLNSDTRFAIMISACRVWADWIRFQSFLISRRTGYVSAKQRLLAPVRYSVTCHYANPIPISKRQLDPLPMQMSFVTVGPSPLPTVAGGLERLVHE